ncbi:uncharacterized protein DS421_4g113790 [Arachis hypogaea]|nr:uncharacterized protein DS421_4g113790 [Arachis hypogaea]
MGVTAAVAAAVARRREGDLRELNGKRGEETSPPRPARCAPCCIAVQTASLSSRAVAIADQDPSSLLFPAPPSRPSLAAKSPHSHTKGERSQEEREDAVEDPVAVRSVLRRR